MKKLNRRSFFKITVSGIVSLIVSQFSMKKHNPHKDPPLKEADFYKKHNLKG
ncbi:MAG: hypothetical protein ABII23_08340 [bacterium]